MSLQTSISQRAITLRYKEREMINLMVNRSCHAGFLLAAISPAAIPLGAVVYFSSTLDLRGADHRNMFSLTSHLSSRSDSLKSLLRRRVKNPNDTIWVQEWIAEDMVVVGPLLGEETYSCLRDALWLSPRRKFEHSFAGLVDGDVHDHYAPATDKHKFVLLLERFRNLAEEHLRATKDELVLRAFDLNFGMHMREITRGYPRPRATK